MPTLIAYNLYLKIGLCDLFPVLLECITNVLLTWFLTGPVNVKGPRPTKSALKRKYADISDGESDDDGREETASDEVAVDKRQEEFNLSQGHGMLKPKNLFGTSFINTLQPKRPSLGRYHVLQTGFSEQSGLTLDNHFAVGELS